MTDQEAEEFMRDIRPLSKEAKRTMIALAVEQDASAADRPAIKKWLAKNGKDNE